MSTYVWICMILNDDRGRCCVRKGSKVRNYCHNYLKCFYFLMFKNISVSKYRFRLDVKRLHRGPQWSSCVHTMVTEVSKVIQTNCVKLDLSFHPDIRIKTLSLSAPRSSQTVYTISFTDHTGFEPVTFWFTIRHDIHST